MQQPPAQGMDMSGDMPDSDASKRSGLLTLNDLTYLLEPDLSVATNVTSKNHFFQGTEYTQNQRAVCIINSGADYIDTRSSYLKFDVQLTTSSALTSGVQLYFGQHGSAVNLIKNVTITTRSGDEISRITDVNRLHAMMSPYRYNADWASTVGQPMGYGSKINQFAAGTTKHSFCIPLYCLTDFFGYGRLIPSMIMSGLRIEIEFEDISFAGITTCASVTAGNDARFGATRETTPGSAQTIATTGADGDASKLTGYKILNPVVSLKSVQLTDATQRALNELSATNGLELVFTDYERTETIYPAATTKAHVEIRKACSRALSAICRVREDKSQLIEGDGSSVLAQSYKENHIDSFASEPASSITEYQWQLGSLYFPQQPIKGTATEVATEGYLHTLDALGKLKAGAQQPLAKLHDAAAVDDLRSTQRSVDWQADTTDNLHSYLNLAGNYTNNGVNQLYDPIVAKHTPGTFRSFGQSWIVGLERSSLFELAGVPINNSRVLALRMAFETSKKRTVDVYLKYVKLARLFLNNVEIEQ